MRYNDFKDLKISALGFGTMRLPMTEDGSIDYDCASLMAEQAIQGGITYFDTAYRYHEGESENFCGSVLSQYPRSSYMLADKLPTWLCKTREDAEKIFAEQLAKCRVDYFDFYLLHNVDEETWPNIEKLGLVDFVREKKEAGKAVHVGLSVHCEPKLLDTVLSKHGDVLEFVQIQINYFDWEYKNAKALHQTARRYGKPVIVMEPVRGGMLANIPSPEVRSILDDASKKDGQPGASYASIALRYAEQLDGVLCTLSGMSSPEQMAENIATFSGPVLGANQLAAIPEAGSRLRSDIIIPCTGCNYCYECPSGIKIPDLFSWYNEAAAKGFHWVWGSLSAEYEKLGPDGKDCIGCGNCQAHCPQKINIIGRLQEILKKKEELKEAGE